MLAQRRIALNPPLRQLESRWTLIPCAPSCKQPLIPWAELREPSPARVAEWAEKFEGCNWAVKVGPASGGLIVVDIDAHGTKAEAFGTFDAIRWTQGAELVPTPWHETYSGYHLYYRLPERDLQDLPPKIVIHRETVTIEILLRDQLALIPPSTVAGFPYAWRLPPGPVRCSVFGAPVQLWPAKAPAWLLRLIENCLGKTSPRPEVKTRQPRTLLDALRENEELIKEIHKIANRPYPGLGKGFRCFLPGHSEQHPSASWWRTASGEIRLHDWHSRDGYEWLSIGEVIHALRKGQVRKLSPNLAAEETLHFAAHTKILAAVVERTCDQWAALWAEGVKSKGLYRNTCFLHQALDKVLKVFLAQFRSAARRGSAVVALGVPLLSDLTGLPVWAANRASNAAALLGVVVKLPIPPWADKRYLTRWVLCVPDPPEFYRRWELLKDVPLRELNRRKAAELFGEEAASRVFRRG